MNDLNVWVGMVMEAVGVAEHGCGGMVYNSDYRYMWH